MGEVRMVADLLTVNFNGRLLVARPLRHRNEN